MINKNLLELAQKDTVNEVQIVIDGLSVNDSRNYSITVVPKTGKVISKNLDSEESYTFDTESVSILCNAGLKDEEIIETFDLLFSSLDEVQSVFIANRISYIIQKLGSIDYPLARLKNLSIGDLELLFGKEIPEDSDIYYLLRD